MGLPKEYLTPSLESLPEDLRARAEAIIKKKFGIKEPKKRYGYMPPNDPIVKTKVTVRATCTGLNFCETRYDVVTGGESAISSKVDDLKIKLSIRFHSECGWVASHYNLRFHIGTERV